MRHQGSVDLWATSWDIMSFASFWMSAKLCIIHASSRKISMFPVKLVGQLDDSDIRFPSISNPCCFRASLKASRTLRAHQERTTRLWLWRLVGDTFHQSESGSRCAIIWRILGRIGWMAKFAYLPAMGGVLCLAQYRYPKLLVFPTNFKPIPVPEKLIVQEDYWYFGGCAGSNGEEWKSLRIDLMSGWQETPCKREHGWEKVPRDEETRLLFNWTGKRMGSRPWPWYWNREWSQSSVRRFYEQILSFRFEMNGDWNETRCEWNRIQSRSMSTQGRQVLGKLWSSPVAFSSFCLFFCQRNQAVNMKPENTGTPPCAWLHN